MPSRQRQWLDTRASRARSSTTDVVRSTTTGRSLAATTSAWKTMPSLAGRRSRTARPRWHCWGRLGMSWPCWQSSERINSWPISGTGFPGKSPAAPHKPPTTGHRQASGSSLRAARQGHGLYALTGTGPLPSRPSGDDPSRNNRGRRHRPRSCRDAKTDR